jgi:competence protein ComEC
MKLRDRWTMPSLAVSCLLLVACASAPGAPPTPAARAGRPTNDGPRQAVAPSSVAPSAARAGAAARKVLSPPPGSQPTPQLSGLPDSRADANTMVAHFIDVGQGDATLLEFSCGAILVDTGGEKTPEVSGRERLVSYLEEFFERRSDLARTLELVVLSHPHSDHTDGVDGLLQMNPSITINNVLDNGTTNKGSGITGQKHLQQFARDSGAGYVGLAEADITTLGGVTNQVIDPVDCRASGGADPKITALWGRVDLDAGWANDANNDSVVLRVEFGAASFLFTGDMEERGLAEMLDSYADDASVFDADVLKVGHHGSHNGTSERLVAAVSPKIAVAQSGDSTLSQATYSAYSFGHPHRDAVNLLREPAGGVSQTRPTKRVRVGVRGRNSFTGAPPKFSHITLTRAVFDNGWDGNIAITATTAGTLTTQTEF